MHLSTLSMEIHYRLVSFFDKKTVFHFRLLNRYFYYIVHEILFNDAFYYFEVEKLICIYSYTIPFNLIVNCCPYLRLMGQIVCENIDMKMIESEFFFGNNTLSLLKRLDLEKFISVLIYGIQQIEQIRFKMDLSDTMKFLLNQIENLKIIDISISRGYYNEIKIFENDKLTLGFIEFTCVSINLSKYWYKIPNIRNYIKYIEKVSNSFKFLIIN